jgi:hypothetical protein
MRRRESTPSSSSSDGDGADIESCFDVKNEQEKTDADTDPTDVDTDVDDIDDVEGGDDADLAWIAGEDNANPPEYYLDQENNSDESEDEDEDEDYMDTTVALLDMIEAQFDRYVPSSIYVPSSLCLPPSLGLLGLPSSLGLPPSAFDLLLCLSFKTVQIYMKGSGSSYAGYRRRTLKAFFD